MAKHSSRSEPLGDSDPASDLLVIIPTFNEEKSIGTVIEGVLEHIQNVLVIDDASTDRTKEVVATYPVELVRQPENRGKGAALLSGFRLAVERGAAGAITLDGDGQHDPAQLPSFITTFAEAPDHFILGSRLWDKSAIPAARYNANQVANFWISWASGWPIEDSQCGFRLYPKRVMEEIAQTCSPKHGFVFESEVLIEACRNGVVPRSVRIPAIYPATPARRSHFRPVKDITLIVRMVAGKLLARFMHPVGLWRGVIAPTFRDPAP